MNYWRQKRILKVAYIRENFEKSAQPDEQRALLQACTLRSLLENGHPSGQKTAELIFSVKPSSTVIFSKSHWKFKGAQLPGSTEKGISEDIGS